MTMVNFIIRFSYFIIILLLKLFSHVLSLSDFHRINIKIHKNYTPKRLFLYVICLDFTQQKQQQQQ